MQQIRKGLVKYLRSSEIQSGIVICEQSKFLYMKPAKTAGTSVYRHCLKKHIPELINKKDNPEKYYQWINNITDEELEDYFIFSVVRNPWDRLVSVSKHFKIPLQKFLKEIGNFRKDPIIRSHSLPCHYYTHFNGAKFVDFVCRFESLQPDINLVFDRINIERERLKFVNCTEHHHYSYYYTDNEINIVKNICQKDIEFFGYMFEEEAVRRFKKSSFRRSINRFLSSVKPERIHGLIRQG